MYTTNLSCIICHIITFYLCIKSKSFKGLVAYLIRVAWPEADQGPDCRSSSPTSTQSSPEKCCISLLFNSQEYFYFGIAQSVSHFGDSLLLVSTPFAFLFPASPYVTAQMCFIHILNIHKHMGIKHICYFSRSMFLIYLNDLVVCVPFCF